MPNHVTTRCIVTGPIGEVNRFRANMFRTEVENRDTGTVFDFNAVIPMPEVLRDTESGTAAEYGMALIIARDGLDISPPVNMAIYPAWKEKFYKATGLGPSTPFPELARAYLEVEPRFEEAGRKSLEALITTGYTDWYNWSTENWGTKWNAYATEIVAEDPFEFTFDTAWGFPEPVFEAIVGRYPTLHFECYCYDEGSNFAGRGFYNPLEGEEEFHICDATDDLYEVVYGHPPEREEDYDDEEWD